MLLFCVEVLLETFLRLQHGKFNFRYCLKTVVSVGAVVVCARRPVSTFGCIRNTKMSVYNPREVKGMLI
jgi:hypothetical protein